MVERVVDGIEMWVIGSGVDVGEGRTAGLAVCATGVGTDWAALGGVGDEVGGLALAAGPDVGHAEGVVMVVMRRCWMRGERWGLGRVSAREVGRKGDA